MALTIRIRMTKPAQTAGSARVSPAALISGTAVPALTLDLNTVGLLPRDMITIGRLGRVVGESSPAPLKEVKGRVSVAKRSKKRIGEQTDFTMMPAYSSVGTHEIELRGVNTPLKVKAKEEISDFEREYPW